MIDFSDIAGLPAARKVLIKVRDALELARVAAPARAGVQIFIDRSFEEPFDESELTAAGAIAIRVVDTVRSPFDFQSTLHRAAFDFDIGTLETQLNSIDATQMDLECWIVEVLGNDEALKLLCQQINPQTVTGSENDGAEAGIAVSTFELQYLTPRKDFRTILGATGPIS